MVEECRLLGDTFAWMVQFWLGLGAFIVLLMKRHFEIPQRSWLTWFRDGSKQGFGSVAAHVMNLYLSHILAASGNECKWYFVNYLTDNVVGMLLNFIVLKVLERIIRLFDAKYVTGRYSGVESPWREWLGQMLLWTVIVCGNKLIIFYAFLLPLRQPLYHSGDFLLSPLDPVPRLELVFVMIAIPGVLNTLQFWVQDQYLKDPGPELLYNADYGDESEVSGPRFDVEDDDDEDNILDTRSQERQHLMADSSPFSQD